MLNPIRHALSPAAVATYRTEPYAVAADIYSEGERRGRGSWTWYTGSAGWLYRAAIEGILAIRRSGGRITVRPNLPAAWPGFAARVKIEGTVREIIVTRSGDGSLVVRVDGTSYIGPIHSASRHQDRAVSGLGRRPLLRHSQF